MRTEFAHPTPVLIRHHNLHGSCSRGAAQASTWKPPVMGDSWLCDELRSPKMLAGAATNSPNYLIRTLTSSLLTKRHFETGDRPIAATATL